MKLCAHTIRNAVYPIIWPDASKGKEDVYKYTSNLSSAQQLIDGTISLLFYSTVVRHFGELALSSGEMQWQRNSRVDAKRNKVSSVSAVFPRKLITVQSCARGYNSYNILPWWNTNAASVRLVSYTTPWLAHKSGTCTSIVYRTSKWHTYIN